MFRLRHLVLWLVVSALAAASPYRGLVTFAGLPLPGATITATQDGKTLRAVSDASGDFAFDDLADGTWTIAIQMQCFEPLRAQVTVAPKMPAAAWEMKLLPSAQIMAHAQTATPEIEVPPAPAAADTKNPEAQAGQRKQRGHLRLLNQSCLRQLASGHAGSLHRRIRRVP